MSNSKFSKRSKRSNGSKATKSRKSVSWRSIFWLLIYTGLMWNTPDEAKFNFNLNLDFSQSELNVNIAQAATCCDKAVVSPFV